MTDLIKTIITTRFGDTIPINNWTSYTYDSDFFTPCDGFNFELADNTMSQIYSKISFGDRIQLYINDKIQCTGMIDTANISYSRSGGTILHLTGRDLLSVVADATITPAIQNQIKPSSTYGDVFNNIFTSFNDGINFNFHVIEDDTGFEATLSSGGKAGKSNPKNVGSKKRTRLSTITNSQIRPNKNEGYLEYAIRLCKRNGWNIKLSADGENVYIFSPTYDRDSAINYKVTHFKNDTTSNILNANLNIGWSHQPSVIIGEATTGGGNFRNGAAEVIYVNELMGYDSEGKVLDDLNPIINTYKNQGTLIIPSNEGLRTSNTFVTNRQPKSPDDTTVSPFKTMYVYDQESHSPSDIEFYVRTRMSELQEKFLTLTYELDGHSDRLSGNIWTINNLVNVKDPTFQITGNYWIKRRTFTKSRSGGTKTKLELKLPYIWNFS